MQETGLNGTDARVTLEKGALLTCKYLGYVEGIYSLAEGTPCGTHAAHWHLGYQIFAEEPYRLFYEGSSITTWAPIWAQKNKVKIVRRTYKTTGLCPSTDQCMAQEVEWEEGTEAHIWVCCWLVLQSLEPC